MKFILAPDSFKGTLNSIDCSSIMKNAIKQHYPNATILTFPIADGGEGTVDAILSATRSKKIYVNTTNALKENIKTYYGLNNEYAIIEMASASGITLIDHLDIINASTYGVGLIILDAIKKGAKKIILGLGGSATNDLGVGCLLALGAKFYNESNDEFIPNSITLSKIKSFDFTKLYANIKDVEIIGMCDVKNPLYGNDGCSYIFSPQKGATKEIIDILDKNIYSLAQLFKDKLNIELNSIPGSGAAGGMGAMILLLNGKLQSGIDTILDLIEFDKHLDNCDFVFTGEGRIDEQSVNGKVLSGIAKRCKKKNVPVIALCGAVGNIPESLYDMGITTVMSINQSAMELKRSRYFTKQNVFNQMDHILRLIKNLKGE